MDPFELKKWVEPNSTQPFDIVLSTGKRLAVRHPELLLVGRRTSILVSFDERRLLSDYVLFSNVHIAKLQRTNGAPIEPAE